MKEILTVLVMVVAFAALVHQSATLSDKNAQISDLRSENDKLASELAEAQARDQQAATEVEACGHTNDAVQAAAYSVIAAFGPGNTESVRADATAAMAAVENVHVLCHGGTRLFPMAGM